MLFYYFSSHSGGKGSVKMFSYTVLEAHEAWVHAHLSLSEALDDVGRCQLAILMFPGTCALYSHPLGPNRGHRLWS